MGKETSYSCVYVGELRCSSGNTTETSQVEPREGGAVEDTGGLDDPWVDFEVRQDFRWVVLNTVFL